MKVISVVSAKGGTGKSTLTLLLSATLSEKEKVVVLDSDVQSTCLSAKKINPDLPFEVFSTSSLGEILGHGKEIEGRGAEWLIIDTNPRSFFEDSDQINGLLEISDLCLLPCRPAPRDLRANLELAGRLKESGVNARLVWNFVQPRANAHKESIKQAPKFLGIKPLKNFINQRICYQDIFNEPPLPNWNIKATEELKRLTKEIRRSV